MMQPTDSAPRIEWKDFMIWLVPGLKEKQQQELEIRIRSIIDPRAHLHSTTIFKSEGIRFWVAAITPEQEEEIKEIA
jgi:hypothetical protein